MQFDIGFSNGRRLTVPATLGSSLLARFLPVRKRFPAHLPRELVVEVPSSCHCCGSARTVKMGEDITELDVIPRQWKVVQTVSGEFTCRECEKI